MMYDFLMSPFVLPALYLIIGGTSGSLAVILNMESALKDRRLSPKDAHAYAWVLISTWTLAWPVMALFHGTVFVGNKWISWLLRDEQ